MCKKIACILIILTMIFSVLPVALANEVNAEKEMKIITEVPMESIVSEYNKNTEPKSDDDLIYKKYGDYLYYYLNNNDTEITIVDCDDLATGEITVPSEIEGLPVTWICDIAFSECKNITKIVIPEGVKWIGENTFYNCNSLNEIIIPTTVELIGRGAFYGTAYYNNASNWNNGFLCIGNNLIEADKAISGSCEIPSHINTIASYAFEDCTNLTEITIPENVKNIGENTFYHCNNLTTVNFNAAECSIMGTSNHPVFNTCRNLTSVNIGNNVTEIPDNAFLNCVNMKKNNNTEQCDNYRR